MRLQIFGFINLDRLDLLPGARASLVEEWKKGNFIISEQSETIVDTAFDDIPRTWTMLYSGGNTGKLVTKLKE